jgi:hypothetical protein
MRAAFFLLGLMVAGLLLVICELVYRPGSLFVAGAILVLAAEVLIIGKRRFGTGIEEAFNVGGLLMIGTQLVDWSGGSLLAGSELLAAAALAIAAFRLLNPVFAGLSLWAFAEAVSAFAVRHGMPLDRESARTLFCFAVAVSALAAGRVRFQRPSYDRMLDWLVATMALVGFGSEVWRSDAPLTLTALIAATFARPVHALSPIVLPALLGSFALYAGISRRKHAPFIAFLVCVGSLAYQLRNLTGLSLDIRLIVWGGLGLLLAIALTRFLRLPWRGITSLPGSATLEVPQIALAGTLGSSVGQPPAEPAFSGGGGTFGGAGASREY